MERLNDWALGLIGSCEFWIAAESGFLGLAVYGLLKKMGVPLWVAVIVAIVIALFVFVILRGVVCV